MKPVTADLASGKPFWRLLPWVLLWILAPAPLWIWAGFALFWR